jgi:hypothetical protein
MKRAAVGLCIALTAALVSGDLVPPVFAASPGEIVVAQAQQEKRRGGIFRFLFRNRRKESRPVVVEPPREARPGARQQRQQAAKPRRERRKRPAAAAPAPEVAAVEKAPDAKRVLVLGDFMAGALAKGLAEAYEQDAKVVVVDASNGSSGLVRDDFYDWPAELPALVEKEKPDAILVLVGANDRQDAGSVEFGSDAWKVTYTLRVGAFADALKATGKPVLWAGLAPVRQNAMSRDYSTFNGIFRERLESKGLPYVDVWNGFTDEEGKFVSSGPDVTGQKAQLRVDDGLNFTRSGQRKLAYFVEKELNDILKGESPLLASTESAEPTEPGEPTPRIGPMVPIDALTLGGDTLSTGAAASNEPAAAADAIVERIAGSAAAAPPPARADNYVWPPPPPPSAATSPAAATPVAGVRPAPALSR